VLRGDLQQRIESELVEIDDRFLGALIVGLVDGEQHRTPGLPQLTGDALVAGDQPLAPIDQKDKEIGAGDRAMALLDDEVVQRILAGAVQPAGVEEVERCAAPGDGPRERVARCARDRRHDRAAAAGHSVEKGRFADVRTADKHDRRRFTGHFEGLSKLHLASALTV
jgi:hypothetical protein